MGWASGFPEITETSSAHDKVKTVKMAKLQLRHAFYTLPGDKYFALFILDAIMLLHPRSWSGNRSSFSKVEMWGQTYHLVLL